MKRNKKVDEVYEFYQTISKQWYVDLLTWPGDKGELEMVVGADTMLSDISKGEERIKLRISNKRFKGSSILKRTIFAEQEFGGAFYRLPSFEKIRYNTLMWLCPVMLFIFKKLPQKVYIARA